MKATICIVVGFTLNYLNASNLAPITSIEADQRILTAEIAKREAAAELKSSAEQVTSFYKTKESVGDRKIIFRRVAPPAKLPVTEPAINATAGKSLDYSQFPQPAEEQVNLQLYATVYDGAYSKLILTLEKSRYTIWTNLNFNYLQLLGSFTTEDRHYSYFGITDRIERKQEALTARLAKERGFGYETRWEFPPVHFGEAPEYVLVTEDARNVPEEVYRQLDDLTGYYLANKEQLEIQFHNARELQAARERYKNTHPEEPQDIVLNYSRMSAPAE